MNRIILRLSILFLVTGTYSDQHNKILTAEWINSDEAKAIAAVHRYQWLGNNTAILFDVRQPKEERTFQKLDPRKAGELFPVVDREKAIASLQENLGIKDSLNFLEWPISFDQKGRQGLYIYDNDIFILNLETSGFQRITDTDAEEKSPRFSPDGLKVAFEGDHISANSYKKLSESFPNVRWESTSMILEQMQAVKDDTELEAIRTAVKITDAIYTEILPMLRVGVTEKEIANHLVLRYRQESDGEAYHPIVAGGPNSALPHAIPSNRVFQKGDFILIDAAAKYAGYHADMTRTSVMGSADDKHHEIYTIVKGSQQSGCDAAHAGVPCIEIDRITRDYIKKRIWKIL